MAIEIKELRIKVTVQEATEQNPQTNSINSEKWNELKMAIIRECSQLVLEKIKERQER